MDYFEKLTAEAKAARQNAYAPYSGFRVGAAVLCEDGRIFPGANVENASYGLTICAERVAISAAISYGCRKIKAVAIAAEGFTYPCGACCQVISEFADESARVLIINTATERIVSTTLGELLPKAFRFIRGNEQ